MNTLERIALGGGCFWCTEAIFKMLKGIETVESGYAGGNVPDPTYKQVSTGKTGHAEVVYLEYDPRQIALRDILTVFFATHDGTTPNRQGNDIGNQYRSTIFYDQTSQKDAIERFIENINQSSETGRPIVTQVEPLDAFYPAEIFHQDYYSNNPDTLYCKIVINPKLAMIRKEFTRLLKKNET